MLFSLSACGVDSSGIVADAGAADMLVAGDIQTVDDAAPQGDLAFAAPDLAPPPTCGVAHAVNSGPLKPNEACCGGACNDQAASVCALYPSAPDSCWACGADNGGPCCAGNSCARAPYLNCVSGAAYAFAHACQSCGDESDYCCGATSAGDGSDGKTCKPGLRCVRSPQVIYRCTAATGCGGIGESCCTVGGNQAWCAAGTCSGPPYKCN